MMELRRVRLVCASTRVDEDCRRSERGLHDLKARVFVIFVKKLKHDVEEKFCGIFESQGWGNGVGSVAEVGTVGTGWTDSEVCVGVLLVLVEFRPSLDSICLL